MDKKVFFKRIRKYFGSLNQSQVNGFNLILDEALTRNTRINDLAYILATSWWETARTMQAVREAFYISPGNFNKAEAWRKKNLRYYPYYGRGFVQLTWKTNYKKASDALGIDFVGDPDKVMEPKNAVEIMFTGMEKGWFTGKALDDYIDDEDEPDSDDIKEYIEARRIINGKDKAKKIANLALKFEKALRKAHTQLPEGPLSIKPKSNVETVGAGNEEFAGFDEFISSLGLRYFKPYEFLVKGGKHSNPNSAAFGLNSDPPKKLWENISETAKILDELRHRLQRPIVMTSVYRSPEYNSAIGGASNSLHMKFNAIDFTVRGSPIGPSEWAAVLREMRSKGMFSGGIGVYSTFVHLDTRGTNADWNG